MGSVRRHGGKVEDYLPIHDFIDGSKIAMPDLRHRAALHNAFGCFLVERVFGHVLTNSAGKTVSTRDLAEEHIREDMGFIPSLEDWLDELPLSAWHGGIHRIPKDQRPPTPREARSAMQSRIQTVLGAHGIRRDINCDLINELIAAVRGTTEHQEEG